MSTKSTNNTLVFLTILLCLVVIGLGAYTFKFYNEVKANESQLKKEKELIAEELQEEIARYNTILNEKSILSEELTSAKEQLQILQKRLDSNIVTRAIVQEYQLELRRMRREREQLFKQNDSLQKETQRLSLLQAETQDALEKITKAQDSLAVNNQNLERKLNLGSQIALSNVIAKGVIQRNSGKFVSTSRAARAEMIRVCYDVNENKLAEEKELIFYIQVLNKEGKMIGVLREETLSDGTALSYNSRTKVPYEKSLYKVCELVLPIQKFDKGDYTVNIFHNEQLLMSSLLTLK